MGSTPERIGSKSASQTVIVADSVAGYSEFHTFKVMPRRWVVERSLAWLNKNRRLGKNCERRLNTSPLFVHLAFSVLAFKRL